MSNIPYARDWLERALYFLDEGDEHNSRHCIMSAMSNMTRKPYVRKARAERITITKKIKTQIKKLAKDKRLTLHQIASLTGVRSAGRVSEVLNGLR